LRWARLTAARKAFRTTKPSTKKLARKKMRRSPEATRTKSSGKRMVAFANLRVSVNRIIIHIGYHRLAAAGRGRRGLLPKSCKHSPENRTRSAGPHRSKHLVAERPRSGWKNVHERKPGRLPSLPCPRRSVSLPQPSRGRDLFCAMIGAVNAESQLFQGATLQKIILGNKAGGESLFREWSLLLPWVAQVRHSMSESRGIAYCRQRQVSTILSRLRFFAKFRNVGANAKNLCHPQSR